jgi:hypothetical protein
MSTSKHFPLLQRVPLIMSLTIGKYSTGLVKVLSSHALPFSPAYETDSEACVVSHIVRESEICSVNKECLF